MTLAYHCYGLIADGAKRKPCEEKAVIVYESVDGWRRGYCARHRKDGEAEAIVHHWQKRDLRGMALERKDEEIERSEGSEKTEKIAGTPISGTDAVVTSLGEDWE